MNRLGICGHFLEGYIAYLCMYSVLNCFHTGQPGRGAGPGCWCSLCLPECCVDLVLFRTVLICVVGYGYVYRCTVCVGFHLPHNWMDVGMWCCSSCASVRLPDININWSHIFSNRIPYVCKQHYAFCLGSGFLGELDEELTLISLQ